MQKVSNFAQANAVLLGFVPPATGNRRYTLERITALMQHLGNPQDELKIVHVAGTSGKTSTSYYIAAMLQQSGMKVGLTVSPHIDEVNERIQINGVPMDEQTFCQNLNEFMRLIDDFPDKPTYFEVLIAFVYWVFAKEKVVYAVVEVGLGGLLDGTNVARRADKVCVITDIGLDHTQVLGRTITAIAAQKAGIIHAHNTVFCYDQGAAVMDVVREVCQQQKATLHEITSATARRTPNQLPLFQRRNWYLATHVAQFVAGREHLQLSSAKLQAAAQTLVPARMEVFKVGDKTVIVDGSHNEQKIQTLLKSLKHKYPNQPFAVLASFGHNKDTSISDSLRLLTELATHILLTKFSLGQDEIRRPINPQKLVEVCRKLGYHEMSAELNPQKAFQKLMARPEELLLITGSFYLLNHIRPLLRAI
jgi:dihydrofolate synthase/folylpolyglutamate synthase